MAHKVIPITPTHPLLLMYNPRIMINRPDMSTLSCPPYLLYSVNPAHLHPWATRITLYTRTHNTIPSLGRCVKQLLLPHIP